MKTLENKFKKREQRFHKLIQKLNKVIGRVTVLKLIVFFGGAAATFILFNRGIYFLGIGAFLAFLILFIYLNIQHDKLSSIHELASTLVKINGTGQQRIQGNWKTFLDKGVDFQNQEHAFAYDLDIFGQGSMFQYINCAETFWGREKLSRFLTSFPADGAEIRERQLAVSELSRYLGFRQRIQAEGKLIGEKSGTLNHLIDWGKSYQEKYIRSSFVQFIRVIRVLTILLIILSILKYIPFYIPGFILLFNYILLKINSRETKRTLDSVYGCKENLLYLACIIKTIEKQKFSSGHLNKVKSKLYNNNGHSASKQLFKLSKVADHIASRHNMLYFLYNMITLWDYYCLISLTRWKKDSGSYLSNWYHAIGEFEALSSLAVLSHDNPDWAIPEFIEHNVQSVYAKSMGHPLLNTNRVSNDVQIDDKNKILLITGSNMSGKSTFLRTIGINLILAYAGAPVCAREFTCSLMKVYTCMRVSDNLEKNISSFYAEILRIKLIVEEVRKKNNVFFLLDEIFKGTNSTDRHQAAKVLINQLHQKGAVGLVSTHDLELGELENETGGKVYNYHFQESYQKGEISFDYQLRRGISTTRNAIFLIRAAGIEFDE